ncbi:ATP-binding cassette domain-containing protein [Kitasatospora sp. NPDC051984]|uniref:ATP-binding cassette domain-containing protein n=1 Tax=Kitasatospora sp. NPDC051984 TaxID=3364059 RepID=UPI0037C95358
MIDIHQLAGADADLPGSSEPVRATPDAPNAPCQDRDTPPQGRSTPPGKSTLLKLLSGLYLPQPGGGTISWDGLPIDDLDADGLFRQVALVPQEFARRPLRAAENVHLGQYDGDPAPAVTAAAALTGFDETVARLRSGWRTLLAQGRQGGAALSGGGWQRAAVSRAFFRTARRPGLLIPDEPTSDLRPRTARRAPHPALAARPRPRPDHPARHPQPRQRPPRRPRRRGRPGTHRPDRHLERTRPPRRPVPRTSHLQADRAIPARRPA